MVVKHKIGGKERDFRWTWSAISNWCRMEGIALSSLEEMFLNIDLKAVGTLLFWGYKAANRDDETTIHEFEGWLDDEGAASVMELFEKAGEQLNSFWTDEDAKKKKPTKKQVSTK